MSIKILILSTKSGNDVIQKSINGQFDDIEFFPFTKEEEINNNLDKQTIQGTTIFIIDVGLIKMKALILSLLF